MSNDRADSPQDVILSVADLRRWEDEYHRLSKEMGDLEDRRRRTEVALREAGSRLGKVYELLDMLGLRDRTAHVPVIDRVDSSQRDGEHSDHDDGELNGVRSPWALEVQRVLKASPVYESLASAELRLAVSKGDLGAKLEASDKGYYHAITRLAQKGHLIKAAGRVFTAEGHARYQRDIAKGIGTDILVSPGTERRSPMADAIIRFIGANGGQASAGEIIEFLLTKEEFVGPVSRNKSSAYNVLSRLVSRDRIIRQGNGNYSLPEKNEASDDQSVGDTSEASDRQPGAQGGEARPGGGT